MSDLGLRVSTHMRQSSARDGSRSSTAAPRTGPRPRGAGRRVRRRGGGGGTVHQRAGRRPGPRRRRRGTGGRRRAPDRRPRSPRADLDHPGPVGADPVGAAPAAGGGPDWPWLPLLTGVAVARALREAGAPADLKWPNDVLLGDAKVAGLLVERVETPDGPAAVVGIGINVSTTRAELGLDTATSLAEAGVVVDRTDLLVTLLRSLRREYDGWLAAGGSPAGSGLHAAYSSLCTTLGRSGPGRAARRRALHRRRDRHRAGRRAGGRRAVRAGHRRRRRCGARPGRPVSRRVRGSLP